MRAQLTDAASIPEVVRQMALEEKISFIAMAHPITNFISEVPDMAVPALQTLDGATGVNGTNRMLDFLYSKKGEEEIAADHPWGVLQSLIEMEPEEAEKAAAGDEYLTRFVRFLREGL